MLIRKIQTQERFNEVVKAQQADKHFMAGTTHVVEDNQGNILGSISFIPTAIVWMDSGKNNAASSKRMEEQLQSAFAMNGNSLMMVPCLKTSPYYGYMEKAGYTKVEGFDLFLKKI